MSAMHPSRRGKGCMCCKPWKSRGYGRRERDPFKVQRQLGQIRRYDRKSLERV